MKWYAVAHPGLEPIVARELEGLGVRGVVHPGGVRFEATVEAGAALVHRLRTPSRLLLELVTGTARSPDELVALARRIQWKSWLMPDARLDVHASAKGSRLHFTDTVEKKVAWVVREALKGPRVVDRGPRAAIEQRVSVRMEADMATISLDAGGELLHFRGWRAEQGPAPLRENLAAALLFAAGWVGDEPLVDPFCGAGTIPIEAALLAQGRSPYRRRFAAEEWPSLRLAVPRDTGRPLQVTILGADRDARVLGAAEANVRRAGVEVALRRADVAELEPPPGLGLVLTNPPYGRRLGEGDGRVWSDFGRTLRDRFTGWRVLFLAPEPEMASRVHRGARRLLHFSNGGVRVGAYVVEVV